MKFTKEISINASADTVWNIIGPGFVDVGNFTTAVGKSVANTELPSVNGSPVGGRLCETSIGTISEEILEYDAEAKRLSFNGVIGSKVYSDLVSTNEVVSTGDNSCVVKITPHIVLKPLGLLMYPMVWLNLNMTLKGVLADLKHFAETGEPSAKKLASMDKE